MMGYCDSESCCTHDITRAVVRDGVTHGICLECSAEFDADDMPVLESVIPEIVSAPSPAVAALAPRGAPCGVDVPRLDMDDIAHRWGWL